MGILIALGCFFVVTFVIILAIAMLAMSKKYRRQEVEKIVIEGIAKWNEIPEGDITPVTDLRAIMDDDAVTEFIGAIPAMMSEDINCPQFAKIKTVNNIIEYIIDELRKVNRFKEERALA